MRLLAVLATVFLTAPALAYQPGEVILRGGVATVSPDASSSPLSLNGAELGGTAADVDDGSALGLTATWMLSNRWGVELVAASPFTHDLSVSGLGDELKLGEATHLPPTLLLQYYPNVPFADVQPYFGLGLNYTVFFEEEVSAEANSFFVDALEATGGADIALDDSVGLAAEMGVDFAFGADKRWLLNLAVWWMDIDTEAEVKVPGVGTITADVEVDPLVYMAGLGYRF
ncbi:outer membrane protein W [Microbulbifer aestuariivivens]|uniref:Outer membrane protein W n=1 Tax=Microbulbifer aestuariivivens TaxID=1908308 RepID=A0ABP9WNT6_9GAMM